VRRDNGSIGPRASFDWDHDMETLTPNTSLPTASGIWAPRLSQSCTENQLSGQRRFLSHCDNREDFVLNECFGRTSPPGLDIFRVCTNARNF
jgi:hypothetical protein